MNWYFFAAAVLTFVIGVAHSVLGERMVFHRMRRAGPIPTDGGTLLREGHVRILWASWHVATALGWCVAAALVGFSLPSSNAQEVLIVARAIMVAMVACSLLVLVGTKGRHLGWAGFLGVAVLTGLGLYA
ncbi:hypothetical protein M8A51_15285 [Schlegelella sp. S2-27]|uniref:Uncharacterized protein n=1 Tax=Caldimonas mangrovi TaxID=2944811 RepID=A0ABT0YQ69_9BURK|nr:hypothetical protein [Caldimonas mangrovi]MCM5680888.1 hypothetical protein [Caldimonas mangrovi]